jgi:hypothetical protein
MQHARALTFQHARQSQLQHAALVWQRKADSAGAMNMSNLRPRLLRGSDKDGARRGAANAQRVALALRRKWPKAPQTALEVEKIRCNMDVGLAAMEALSRVLEGRAATMLTHLKNIARVGEVPLDSQWSQHD